MKDIIKKAYEGFISFYKREWSLKEKIVLTISCLVIGYIKGLCLAKMLRKCSCSTQSCGHCQEEGISGKEENCQ